MTVLFQFADLDMNTSGKMETSHVLSVRLGCPRVDGDDEEDDINDLENELSYPQGKLKGRSQWHGDAAELSASSRREYQQPIPLLTNGQSVSGEIPPILQDTHSVRSTSGPLGAGDRVHSIPYVDPRQPVPVRIVDPSKDLNSYELGNVDWKERVEGWKLKHEKNMVQTTNRYAEGKGDIEGTGSNGEELPMADDIRQPMSRVVPISSSHVTPYRVVIILQLIILGFFLQYRCTHPVKDAYPLWLTSVICEVWYAFSWLLDQFPKWYPINRETYLERLALRSFWGTVDGMSCSGRWSIVPWPFTDVFMSELVVALTDKLSMEMFMFGQSPVFIAATFMEMGGIPLLF